MLDLAPRQKRQRMPTCLRDTAIANINNSILPAEMEHYLLAAGHEPFYTDVYMCLMRKQSQFSTRGGNDTCSSGQVKAGNVLTDEPLACSSVCIGWSGVFEAEMESRNSATSP